jgi:hypothetical protein
MPVAVLSAEKLASAQAAEELVSAQSAEELVSAQAAEELVSAQSAEELVSEIGRDFSPGITGQSQSGLQPLGHALRSLPLESGLSQPV